MRLQAPGWVTVPAVPWSSGMGTVRNEATLRSGQGQREAKGPLEGHPPHSLLTLSRSELTLGHSHVLLSCVFGTQCADSSPCSTASLPGVCRAALGNRWRQQSAANSASGAPRSWSRSLAFVALLQAEPRPAVGTRGQPHSWASPSEETRPQDGGGRKLCLGAGTCPIPSRGQTPAGLRLRGMALGAKRALWSEPQRHPRPQGRCLRNKAERADVCLYAHPRV